MDTETYDNGQIQKNLQEQQGEQQRAIYAPQMQEQMAQSQAILVAQTNPNQILKEIEYTLRNVELDEDRTIKVIGPPIMNDKGIARMKFVLKPLVNQGTILSHLEDYQINRMIYKLCEDIIDDLTINWKDYGIGDKLLLDHIVNSVIFPAFMALQRALGQNEKNWLGRISVEHISGVSNFNKPKESSFLSKFKL